MLTVMGIKAKDLEIDLKNTTAAVTKHMGSGPRRISKIEVVFKLPLKISEKSRKILGHTANTCPVYYSLHPDIQKVISFQWEL